MEDRLPPKLKPYQYLFLIFRDELVALKELALEQKLLVAIMLGGVASLIYIFGHLSTKEIVLAADQKGSSWYQMAENARKYVEKTGLTFSIRPSQGTLNNAALLDDPSSGVNVAFLIPGALSPEMNKKFYSLGSLDYEPIWIFYRKNINRPTSLKELAKFRVGIGPTQSGRYVLTEKIFLLNNIEIKNNPHFVPLELKNQLADFKAGNLDVIIFVGHAFDPNVRALAVDPNISLYDFEEADAYTKRLPFFQKVTVPPGSFDIAQHIPKKAVSLIAITTTLAVRKDTNPNIQLAILIATKSAERATENLFFAKRNEFPTYIDPLIELSPVAQRFYDYGPPLLLNYLPFWGATLIDRLTVFFLAIFAILYPLRTLNVHLRKIRFQIKEHNLYAELVAINRQFIQEDNSLEELRNLKEKLNEIRQNTAINHIPIGAESAYFSFTGVISTLSEEIDKAILASELEFCHSL
ncbi:MAG: TAXI family TRAP transporter solute-binding subunit [Burkholderiaceae bacterium]